MPEQSERFIEPYDPGSATEIRHVQYLYRGVHGKHPAIAEARRGIATPGDVNGIVTAEAHNFGRPDDLAKSPFTSWSEQKRFAEAHARQQPGGVVLRLPNVPHRGEGWSWEWSPDEHSEGEHLLSGIRIDVEVLP